MAEEEDAPQATAAPPRRSSWQRNLLLGILGIVLIVAGALVWLDTGAGHRFIVSRISRVAPPSGLRIAVGRIDGSIYSKAVLRDLVLSDPKGRFFSAPLVHLDWWPFAWAYNRLDIDRLAIPQATLHKLPKLNPSKQEGPILPDFDIRLMELRVDRLTVEKPVAGKPHVMSLRGDADVRSGRAVVDLQVRALTGKDALLLALDSRPDDDRFDMDVTVNAPKGGVIAAMAGLTQDGNLRIDGKGTWTNWAGRAVATLDGQPAIGLRLGARSGTYRLDGSVEGAVMAGNGLLQRMTAPRLALTGTGTFESRTLRGELSAVSPAVALSAKGGFGLGGGGFDNLTLDLKLTKPQALLKTMGGRDVAARVRLDGPTGSPRFEYLLAARTLAFGKTVLQDVRASGKGRKAQGGPAQIPVALSARAMEGHGDLVATLVRNFRLDGMLQLQDQKLTSNAMRIRSDKLNGTLLAIADLKTGRYDLALAGDISGLLIHGLGVVDLRTKMKAVPGARGAFTLKGDAVANMRRLDNSFFRTLGGGLPRLKSALLLGPDGQLRFSDLTLDAPHLSLKADGYRRTDGTFRFEGGGAHTQYGPLRLTLDGHIERPGIDLLLERPFNPAGLTDVAVKMAPTLAGYDFTVHGGSTLGPFDGDGQVLLPAGREATIAVRRLQVDGTTAQGALRAVTGGLDGTLDLTGSVTGKVALSVPQDVQQIRAQLTAREASFDGPAPIIVRRGTLDATIALHPAGTTIDASLDARGVRVGPMIANRIQGTAKLVDGSGTVTASLVGQRGRLFELNGQAEISPDRVRITGGGTLDRRPIKLANAAVLTRTDDGWRLAPVTISYAGGTAQFAGRAGGETTEIDARLQKMPLSILDMAKAELGLGGMATGSIRYVRPKGGQPTGNAELRIRGLTRSGLSLSSRPIDLGVNAMLSVDRFAARAVVVDKGQTIGRAQMLLTPLGHGSTVERLRHAPMNAQLRYSGTADTLWRLTGIEIIDLSGPVTVSANARGTMADPSIAGSLATDNAGVDSPITGMRLTGVKARGRFSGSQLVLTEMSGAARGGGTVRGQGSFDFSVGQGVGIDLTMQADNAALLERDDIAATVTGPITIKSGGNGGVIGGDVVLNRSRFTLGRAAAVAQIPQLNVVEINRRGEEIETAEPERPWRLDMHARARNRLTVTGLGIDSEWRADLQLGGTVTNPTVLGTAELVRGDYEFAGRTFQLREGRIRFNGNAPINPTLDIEAEADVSDIQATIKVGGTGLAPEISFTSVPALPEDELLSRILFGTSITSLSAPEALQLASAVAALQDGGGGLDPINAVRKATGLDRLRILPADTTTGQGTSVAAGKYLTRKTYVELITDGQGYSATRIEYQITRWLSVLGAVSTIGRQSMNLRASKDY